MILWRTIFRYNELNLHVSIFIKNLVRVDRWKMIKQARILQHCWQSNSIRGKMPEYHGLIFTKLREFTRLVTSTQIILRRGTGKYRPAVGPLQLIEVKNIRFPHDWKRISMKKMEPNDEFRISTKTFHLLHFSFRTPSLFAHNFTSHNCDTHRNKFTKK